MASIEANIRQTDMWKIDSWKSVEFYNNWFMSFAPQAFRDARSGVMDDVIKAFEYTRDLTDLSVSVIKSHPEIMSVLRMVTAPPLAQDRLVGLSNTSKSLLKTLESGKLPQTKNDDAIDEKLERLLNIIRIMLDAEIFPWLKNNKIVFEERARSAAIIADRLTGVLSDPIIRNAQEQRQFKAISSYLEERGYNFIESRDFNKFMDMPEMSYSFHVNVPVNLRNSTKVNIPIDVAIKRDASYSGFPLLVECKSAGDFANTNKRRKEEAVKIAQLKETYGESISFVLFLCGYFDAGYLGYEAAEGIDWIWEHRISDFQKLGI